MLDALQSLRHAHPELRSRASTGWGAPLLQIVEDGELDAVVVPLPANRTLPETLAGESLGSLKLAVLAQSIVQSFKSAELARAA